MKKILLLCLGLMLAGSAVAEGNNYGAASYLNQGVGARASGLGGAFVALADDATAGYWNPAGLTQMELYNYLVGSQFAFLSNDSSLSYASYAFQVPGTGVFSVSWINHSILDLDKRDETGADTGNFNSSENAFIFSYGRKVYDWVKGLRVGANLKVLQQGLADNQAFGHGLDLAALWQPVLYWDHMIGINVQNLFQQLYWDNSIDRSLVNVKVGVALKFFPSDEELYYNKLITTADVDFEEYNHIFYHVGAEYWPIRSIAVRAGYNGQEITAGASYRPAFYEIDYAFHYDLSDLSANQHRLSILLRFK